MKGIHEMRGKHATDWHKAIADAGTILRTEVGSGVHGTGISGYDDRDEMGICIEPPTAVIGLEKFEQFEHHTAWEREGGLKNRSLHGDLDLVIYSLRKWVRLAAGGNPSVLVPLFAPENRWVTMTSTGHELRDRAAPYILSRMAGLKFSGYLHAQRRSLLSHDHPGKGRDVTRPELIEKYGYDTKFAGHMIRLGHQGVELMRTGKITLPMPEAQRQEVLEVRSGKWNMSAALQLAGELEAELDMLTDPGCAVSPLPSAPDMDWLNSWLSDTYRKYWKLQEGVRAAHRINTGDYP